MKRFKKTQKNRTDLVAKLTLFESSFRENLYYRSIARVTEKEKGLMMVDQLKGAFDISSLDEKEFQQRMVEMEKEALKATYYPKGFKQPEKIKFTRDGEGNIISPFSKKAEELKEEFK